MKHFIRRHLSGEIGLKQALYYELLIIGTMVNVYLGFLKLATIALDFPILVTLAILVLPLPYNFLLCVSVWRSADREASSSSLFARIASTLWFVMMLVV